MSHYSTPLLHSSRIRDLGIYALLFRATGAARGLRRIKWHYLYFLLAAFDLLTVSAGLYMNHRIIGTFEQSVGVNRVWEQRIGEFSQLGKLAAAVDAPGIDVFGTRQVEAESEKMRAALADFEERLAKQRLELQTNLDPAVAAPLLQRFDAISTAMKGLAHEANLIFAYFRAGQYDEAGRRMSNMDRYYDDLTSLLIQLRATVADIQQQNLTRQAVAAANLHKYEAMIGVLVLVMVVGATFYGCKIARQMQLDAEEKRRQMEALSEAEGRTRCILESAAEGIITFDELGQINSSNHAADSLLGYGPGEAIGKGIGSLIPVLAKCQQARPFDDPGTSLDPGGESTAQRHDGGIVPVELSVSNIRIGGRTLYIAIVRDISDRRKAEEALQIAAAAEAASHAKSAFLAVMSHEIRTPMNGVIGALELALATRRRPHQRECLQLAKTSAHALLQIINDVLDFSRVEAGKLQFEAVDFALRDSLNDALAILRVQAKAKGLELSCDVSPEVPQRVIGDPGRLRQVVVNLVGNAIKFTEHGRVRVQVEAQKQELQDVTLHFSVQDTGMGIPAERHARIFAPFEQADSSNTRRYGGTGLGLAISAKLVDIMHGSIWLNSEVGKGSTFHFTARLRLPDSLDSQTGTRDTSELRGTRVLVVDDDPTNCGVIEQLLVQWGVAAVCVHNGEAALQAAQQTKSDPAGSFQLILLDSEVPDGLQAVEQIQKDPELAAPIILMSPCASAASDSAAGSISPQASNCSRAEGNSHRLGIAGRVAKPIRQAQLLEAIFAASDADYVESSGDPSFLETLRPQRRLRILLTEDNFINQNIAVRVLEGWGHSVEVANTGSEALARLKHGFDLVLMDIQMPGMDGFEVTRAIRKAEAGTGQHIPIIAVTAHAMEADRQSCIRAGMDGYVSKPLDFRDLFDKVERASSAMEVKPGGNARVASPAGSAAEPAALPVGAEVPLGTEFLAVFLKDISLQMHEMRTAVQAADRTRLKEIAHYLKGGAMCTGARRIYRLCRRLELLADLPDLSRAEDCTTALQAESAKLAAVLERRGAERALAQAPGNQEVRYHA